MAGCPLSAPSEYSRGAKLAAVWVLGLGVQYVFPILELRDPRRRRSPDLQHLVLFVRVEDVASDLLLQCDVCDSENNCFVISKATLNKQFVCLECGAISSRIQSVRCIASSKRHEGDRLDARAYACVDCGRKFVWLLWLMNTLAA